MTPTASIDGRTMDTRNEKAAASGGSSPVNGGTPSTEGRRLSALRFVLTVGALSLFADFTYEGSRSVLGPFLALLGASATTVGVVTGFGELVGYGLRLASGRWADNARAIWPITIVGYVVQMAAVPALALAGNWPAAAILIILERTGKALRNPPRDVMLSRVGARAGGLGWAFGVHEALDQFGALIGPLVVALALWLKHDYRLAFAILAAPAVVCLALLLVARSLYPRPEDAERDTEQRSPTRGYSPMFWTYLAGAALVAAGFADYPLIAYHFARAKITSPDWIPTFYAVAMGVSGLGSLVFGRLFDRLGLPLLVVLTAASVLFAPLVFFGGFWGALVGVALWGLGMGVHESIMPAAITPMVPDSRRGAAFGLFTGVYGVAWFIGSAIIGVLYDSSVVAVVVFCILVQLCGLGAFLRLTRSGSRRV